MLCGVKREYLSRRWRGKVNDFKAIGNPDHAEHHAQVQAPHQESTLSGNALPSVHRVKDRDAEHLSKPGH